MKGKTIIIIAIILVLVCCAVFGIYYLENYHGIYYTQIDNSKVKELPESEDMAYEYTLDCYNEKGKKTELTFKTYRVLRAEAYLKLEVRTFGVHSWEEVQYDDLPAKVREKLN